MMHPNAEGNCEIGRILQRKSEIRDVNPIPGQEERNSDHLLEEGVAIRCNNLPVLAFKVDQLLADPDRFARMQANACRLGRPHAARDVVQKLLKLND